jgi:hypothetical protein
MNITQTSNHCTQKCSFSFNYPDVSVKSIIKRESIDISMTQPNIAAVKFNGNEYNATNASISYPSSNTYNGVKADAEITIFHRSLTNHLPLIVTIPIASASNTKPMIFDDIINQTAKLLPKTDYVNLSVSKFTLEDIVPKGSFYFTENNNSYNIVYDLGQSLSLSSSTFETLKKIVIYPRKTVNLTSNPDLFYNEEGSNVPSNGGSDFNFLQCEEVYEEESSNNSQTISIPALQSLWINPTNRMTLLYVLCIIVSIGILYLFYKLFTVYLAQ